MSRVGFWIGAPEVTQARGFDSVTCACMESLPTCPIPPPEDSSGLGGRVFVSLTKNTRIEKRKYLEGAGETAPEQ